MIGDHCSSTSINFSPSPPTHRRVYSEKHREAISDARRGKYIVVAAFWIAIKFVAARHTMPNASFISYVTGEHLNDRKDPIFQSYHKSSTARASNSKPPSAPTAAVEKQRLLAAELDVLVAVDWDVYAIAHRANLTTGGPSA